MAAPAGDAPRQRLAWLDALRGIAVLFVFYDHMGPYLMTGVVKATSLWLPAGRVGVYLFFLVSGYIVPAALEQRGNVRAFLVNRLFRLYPLYLIALALTLVLHRTGAMPYDSGIAANTSGTDPGALVAAHATMLSTMVNVPMILAVTWTLAFEMMFYLLLVALYTLRVLHRSAAIASVLGLASLALAPLPLLLISTGVGNARALAVGALVAVAGALAAMARGRSRAARFGAIGLITLVLSLLVFNEQSEHAWDGLSIIATMFTGTAIYRYDQGRLSRRGLGAVIAVVVVGEVVNLYRAGPQLGLQYSLCEVLVVGLTFAGMRAWGKRREVPHALSYLGVISYSVYLLHDLVLLSIGAPIRRSTGRLPEYLQMPVVLAVFVVCCAVAALSYRVIEAPAQQVGRRLNHVLDARAETRRSEVPATSVPASTVLASSALAGSVPAGAVPASSVPVSGVPVSAVPASSVPVSGVPVSAVPASSVPVSSVPASAVPGSCVPVSSVPVSTVPVSAVPVSTAARRVTPASRVPGSIVAAGTRPANTVRARKLQSGSLPRPHERQDPGRRLNAARTTSVARGP